MSGERDRLPSSIAVAPYRSARKMRLKAAPEPNLISEVISPLSAEPQSAPSSKACDSTESVRRTLAI